MKQFNLDEYFAHPGREVVTRDGRNVTIHCTNYDSLQPIIAEVEGYGSSHAFHKDGKYFTDRNSHIGLFFAAEIRKGWVNIYENKIWEYEAGVIYGNEKDAKKHCTPNCIATTKIEWEE